eukprot:113431-Pleurochrysis_carterae.AAC.1
MEGVGGLSGWNCMLTVRDCNASKAESWSCAAQVEGRTRIDSASVLVATLPFATSSPLATLPHLLQLFLISCNSSLPS